MAKDPYKFVRATGRDKYWRTQDQELADLTATDTGLLKEELGHHVACVVCKSKRHNLAFVKQGFAFVKCCDCGLVFVNPQLDESRLLSSYAHDASHDQWVDVLLTPAQQAYDAKHRFGEAIRRLEKMYPRKKRGRVLDVGCSIGLFLKLMRDRGWEPLGLEINPKAVQYAREHFGLAVDEKLLHEVNYPDRYFQIISLWGVLEHTKNPDEILLQARRLLDPRGRLVILVPNGHSLATRIMHEHSPTFGGRNHLWYFTPSTLTRLLKRTGYQVQSVYTQLSQFDELLHFMRYNDPYLAQKKVSSEEFNVSQSLRRAIERFMIQNHLGYKLIVFASTKIVPS
ncbi:MAG: class I SAM-dependent methyltransferase [Candidatus Omnitrophica bacterium]|nr:class I SAM-dependent methyltransferase [Candidatus Omnitrophota bacterium]